MFNIVRLTGNQKRSLENHLFDLKEAYILEGKEKFKKIRLLQLLDEFLLICYNW
jgi:DNA-binding transcriptional ArsR family regulator